MKKCILFLVSFNMLLGLFPHAQILNKIKQKVKEKVEQKADGAGDADKNSSGNTDATQNNNTAAEQTKAAAARPQKDSIVAATAESFKSFQNYDFVPGDKVLFEDDWRDDDIGEFPSRWKLTQGEFLVNKYKGNNVLLAKERSDDNGGSEGWNIRPRLKTENYLPKEFTVELDFTGLPKAEREGYDSMTSHTIALSFWGKTTEGSDISAEIVNEYYRDGRIYTVGFPNEFSKTPLASELTHKLCVVYKNSQMKVFADGQRLFTIPEVGFEPQRVELHFLTENKTQTLASVVNHIRIAEGGSMNLVKKLITDNKFIARGITFDYQKATLKPESMGEFNRIAAAMKEDVSLRFEIGGHTSKAGSGAAAANLKLSEDRANAVRSKLIEMGIAATRLTAKGYGETMPIADNATPEGRANNQRVEFTKLK